jgi:di/tricarboxylate transporter
MTARTYASPLAFKTALETRLRQRHGGPAVARGRQLLIFDRFLARVTTILGDTAVLKGNWEPSSWQWVGSCSSFASSEHAPLKTSTYG